MIVDKRMPDGDVASACLPNRTFGIYTNDPPPVKHPSVVVPETTN